MPKLSLDALKVVKMIKMTGSFSMTARLMNKTPSAISYRVLCIEKKLGLKLFTRNGPIITLTQEGEIIAKEGEWILEIIENLESKLMIKNPINPIFNIGVSESFSLDILGGALRDFLIKYPKLKISINKMKGGEEWEMLGESKLDLVVSGRSCPSHINVRSDYLGGNKMILCASMDYAEKHRDDIKNSYGSRGDALSIITNSNLDTHVRYDVTQLKIKNKILVNDLDTQLYLIEKGYGIGIIPILTVKERLKTQMFSLVDLGYELGQELVWIGWDSRNMTRYKSWWVEESAKLKSILEAVDGDMLSSVV